MGKSAGTLTPGAWAIIKADAPVKLLRACRDIRVASGPATRPPTALTGLRRSGGITHARPVGGWRP